jgi:phosphomevalonate kinase
MGERAGVGIEPKEQTALADATEAVEGVLCAGVPGAGGVDAIFAITLGTDTRSRVESMWSHWTVGGAAVCALVLHADNGEFRGIRKEL